jgi:hypothetical protein
MKKKRGIMKTIALTLFATALGMAQTQSSAPTGPPPPPKVATPAAKTSTKTSPIPVATKPKPVAKPVAKPVPDKQAEQKSRALAQAEAIPAGAKLVEPFIYRYTDSSGKVWMYRQTPFGINKWEETSTPSAPAAAAKSEPIKVTDLGDSVRFEKKTPFGDESWTRKKTELTDEDKALVEGQSQPSATKPAEKP